MPATNTTPTVEKHKFSKLKGRPTITLWVILVCQLMVVLDTTIVNVALPHIRTSLHFSATSLSWVLNAYTLTFGGLLLLGARAGDIVGRRNVFLGGLALFTVASLAGGFATNSTTLLAARALQGIGGAFASPVGLALLLTMFSEGRDRNRAVGLYTAVSIGGAALGLIAGGLITQWSSWRWVFFVNVPIGIAVLAVAWAVMVESPRRPGRFDLGGALTSTLGMTALVYGFVRGASDGLSDDGAIAAFATGVALLIAFAVIESRVSTPIIPLRLFADRSRASSYLARLLMVAGMMGMFFFLTQFLQNVLHYGPLACGFAFVPLPVSLFITSQLNARILSERFSSRRLILVGLTLSTTGVALLTQLSASSSYIDVLGPLLLFGVGNGIAFIPLTAASLSGVHMADAGAASGLVNVMQQLGGSVGLAVLVTVFGSVSREALQHPPAGMTSTAAAQHAFVLGSDRGFLTATLFLGAALVLVALAIRPSSPRDEPLSDIEEELITADLVAIE